MDFDSTTLASYRAASGGVAKAQAVRDSIGSGTLTVEIRDGATLYYSGDFTGPLTAGSDGSLSVDVVPTGVAILAGTANASTWTCKIMNAGGTRWLSGSIGSAGRFTLARPLLVGQGVRLNISISAAQAPVYGLLFPSNVSGSDQSAPYVALKFANPHSNGLPIWGPSGAGVTYIWEYTPAQQTGYYATFWWSNDGSFLWDGGSSNTYVGAHPYPQSGDNTGTTHWWEIAGMASGADNINALSGSPKTVVYDVKYTQALRITVNGDGTKTARFYTSLPSVANADVISADAASTWGESNPPSPCLTFGDSPWYASFQHERMSGLLGRVKIIAKSLSESDLLAEAADMSSLKTSDGLTNIWWGKTTFDSVDDLTCDYGTGHAFAWADASNKATLTLQG